MTLKHRAEKNRVRVRGTMKLNNMYFPFNYQVPHDQDFDHDAHIKDLEKKALKWEKQVERLNGWAAMGTAKIKNKKTDLDIDVTIHDCTLIPEASDDWRLFCKVEIEGEMHRFNFHYKDPDDAMSLAQLQDIIAAAVEEHAVVLENLGKHKEKLDALASEAQEKTPRPLFGV
jgi:hypothetical protein